MRKTLSSLAGIALASLVLPSGAGAATERLDPVRESRSALVFAVGEIASESVTGAQVLMRMGRSTIRRKLDARALAEAPGGLLRVRKPRPARDGQLIVTTEPAPAPTGSEPDPSGGEPAPVGGGEQPAPGTAGCDPAAFSTAGCAAVFADPGSSLDPTTGWGKLDCAEASRHRVVDGTYRELRVIDGDDVWGERCELGRNDHRTGPTAVYREGDRSITSASFRLPASYPLENTSWQVVMQMKQTQPSANGGGTPVISLEAKGGRWRLLQSTSSGPSGDTRELWTAPAARGAWTRFAFDVTYSQDPAVGAIRVYADLDGDGDASGAGEQSPRIGTYTLKRETEGGSATDGIAPGESIPSHLRVGIYHHPAIACPPPAGCAVEIDDVQIADIN